MSKAFSVDLLESMENFVNENLFSPIILQAEMKTHLFANGSHI